MARPDRSSLIDAALLEQVGQHPRDLILTVADALGVWFGFGQLAEHLTVLACRGRHRPLGLPHRRFVHRGVAVRLRVLLLPFSPLAARGGDVVLRDGLGIEIEGLEPREARRRELIDTMERWLGLSPFAVEERRVA